MRLLFVRGIRKMYLLFLLPLVGILLTAGSYPLQTKLHYVHPKTLNTSMAYYGVHVPGQLSSLTQLKTFEHNVNKAPSIVMWYQGWGVSDSSRYFQPSWMNNVRNHGSIPMVTWEPWNYTQGVNQPDYSLAGWSVAGIRGSSRRSSHPRASGAVLDNSPGAEGQFPRRRH